MDHTPGARQFRDLGAWSTYYGASPGCPRPRSTGSCSRCRRGSRPLASNRAALVTIARCGRSSWRATTTPPRRMWWSRSATACRWPSSRRRSRPRGLACLRHQRHGGAERRPGRLAHRQRRRRDAGAGRHLDMLSSDYVPASLLMAGFELPRRIEGYDLNAALNTVTLHPARATGLERPGPHRRRFARRSRAHPHVERPSCGPRGLPCRPTRALSELVRAEPWRDRPGSRRPRRGAERGGQGRHPPRDTRTARSGISASCSLGAS